MKKLLLIIVLFVSVNTESQTKEKPPIKVEWHDPCSVQCSRTHPPMEAKKPGDKTFWEWLKDIFN